MPNAQPLSVSTSLSIKPYLQTLLSLSTLIPSERTNHPLPGHTMISHYNLQLIIDALADYADQTGTDLSQNPFAEKIQHFNTPDAILELLQEREKSFKEYRNANRGLIDCLSPAVRVLHAFSGILGEAVSLVSHAYLIPLYVSPTRS
jgi:hypothetical protein